MSRAISKQLQFWIACLVVMFSTAIAPAVNTIVEHFDYTDGTSVGTQGGVENGWAGTGIWSPAQAL